MTLAPKQCKVAVIGAGAAGLVAARELRRKEGHEVVVFEQQDQLGGTWLYTDEVESDVWGSDPQRVRVHSSMYQGLTTNLPREVMGFSDFPFSPHWMSGRSMDSRLFPCSEEVLCYLQAFADHYQLHSLVRYSTRVVQATPTPNNKAEAAADQRWRVQWQDMTAACDSSSSATAPVTAAAAAGCQVDTPESDSAGPAAPVLHAEEFDALLVCNGHYSEPHLPAIPGAADFPGLLMHSHNYRTAERFKGQQVAVVGASFSGLDIARLVSQQAAAVYVCAREWRSPRDLDKPAVRGCSNIQRRGMISHLTATGAAEFSVGASVPHLDAVICCTGYSYHFPFLDLKELGLSTQQQHVAPLYQHMFPPTLAPSLAFIGLPWRVVPFPMFELQAKLCARLLSGRASLPPVGEMTAWVQQQEALLSAAGLTPQHSHCLDYRQLHYHAWLAESCGRDVSRLPNWRAVVLHGMLLLRWLWVAVQRIRRRAAREPYGPA